jgi:hypothetical protein
MNDLIKFLVDSIINEGKITKKVVVYSGRFQPFHRGHYATYQNLVSKFGKDSVYIATSNKTDNDKSPFGFIEKKLIMNKMFGIPTNKIVQIKNPYAPVEVLDKYDEKTTAYITAVGEKDASRLGGKYFDRYKDNGDLEGYIDKGYVYIVPAESDAISGTDVRNMLGKGSEKERKAGFMKAYPKFDEKIFKLITLTLNKLSEDVIPGGLSNGKTIADFVKKYDPKEYYHPSQFADYIKEKIKKGAKVEMEHTTDKKIAVEIAKDHIWEDLNYYEKLKTIEIKEDTGGDAFPNDGNSTSGYQWNADWDDYDNQDYYLYGLDGWDFYESDPSEKFKKMLKGLTLPIDNHNDENGEYWNDTHKLISPEEFFKLNEGPTKGLYAGTIKIGGHPVKIEVELIGADNKTKEFITKIIHIDSKYFDKLKVGSEFRIPARIFRTPGGGWYKIKSPSTFGEMAKSDMDKVEKYADSQLSPEDVVLGKETDHFFQRLNDPRNGKEISPAELTGFFKRLARNKKKFLEFLKQYKEFVVKDKPSNINIAFMQTANKLIAKTIMRKADFKSATPVFTTESLLMEGGAYGHMNHPFDIEMNLTFGDLKRIVKQALSGKLEFSREKTDGQALAVSWINGRLVAARNKSHLKNKGKDAMGVQDVINKFAGRGSVSDAFSFAIKDLESAIKGLPEASKKKIFKDGKCFMNCEIIYPANTNVIPYGQSLLVFHGTMEYDEAGNAIGQNAEAGTQLAAMVKKVNADVQAKFTIQGPPVQKLPVNKDLKAKQPIFLSKIQALQSEFGLTDKSGVADYHQAWWLNFINKNTSGLDELQKIGLVKRWAFGDKGFRIKDIKDQKSRDWAEKIEKQDQQKITKDNLLKFETIFLGVGAEVLSFMTSVLTVNPEAAKQQMVGRLQTAVDSIKATGDAKNLEKLNVELARIEALGGFDKIVPNEGIVFNYKGNTFKLTGAFAPLNQILGIFTFSR